MRVAATILTCATVFGAALTGSAMGAEPDAGDGSAAHALAEKFVHAAESAERAEAKKAEAEAARREAERIEEARREAARIRAARIKAERIEAEKRRAAYEAEMLARARAEAEARHAEQQRRAEAERRAEEQQRAAQARKAEAEKSAAQERAKAQAAREKAQAEREKARLAAEREKARAEAARLAQEAEERRAEAARVAEKARKAEAERLTAEVEAKRRAEAQRKAEAAKRAEAKRLAEDAAAKRSAEEEKRAAKARAALEAKRLEEARRIANKFREAREARERKKQAAEQSAKATRHSLGGPLPPPDAQPPKKTAKRKSRPVSTRATVLLVLEPRTRRLDGRRRPANPVLCVGAGCYISKGPERPSDYLPRRKALGPINTLGRRAGPCRRQLVCTFRNVELGGTATALQPVDMGFWGHKRHEVHTAHPDNTCDVVHGDLRCSDPIVADGYRAWIVPEPIAAEAGAELLEDALNEGLPPTRSVRSEDGWAEVQAFPTR